MVQTKSAKDVVAQETAATGGGVSLGKGAWDCDRNVEIPPEAEVRRPADELHHREACMNVRALKITHTCLGTKWANVLCKYGVRPASAEQIEAYAGRSV